MRVPVGRYGEDLLTATLQTQADLLMTARAAYRGGDFETSYAAFSRAGAVGPLTVDDLDALATSAECLGHGREATRVGELVYVRLARTDPSTAAAKAVELGSLWLSRGEVAAGQTWTRRARGLLAEAPESSLSVRLAYLESAVAAFAAYAAAISETAREQVWAAIAAADPDDAPRLTRGAARIALAAGDLDEVDRCLRQLSAVAIEDHVLRGAVLVRRRRYHEALIVLQTALRQSRYQATEVYEWMADAHRGLAKDG